MSFLPTRRPHQILTSQSGMVLLFCLIFLTALTLLGLSSSADTLLQSQLSANLQESERARQSALATLSWAEDWLLGLEGPALEVCVESCEGPVVFSAGTLPNHPEFEDISWWREHGQEAGLDPLTGELIDTFGAGSVETPMWLIEKAYETPPAESGTSNPKVWYRILARGSGLTANGVSVIESVITRNWVSNDSFDSDAPEAPGPCSGTEPTSGCGRVSWQELR